MVLLAGGLGEVFNQHFQMRGRILNPVIVEASPNRFADVSAMIRDLVHANKLRGMGFGKRILQARLTGFPFSIHKEIRGFNMVSSVFLLDMLEEVAQWRNEIKAIYPDRQVWALESQSPLPIMPDAGVFKDKRGNPFTSTSWTKKLIGADRANAEGFTGRGTRAVVIDTGARKTHPQLRRVQMLSSAREKGMFGEDVNGHGSWCASCVGGAPSTDRTYGAPVEGMAPECDLVSIQTLGFVIGTGSSSDVIKALEMSIGQGADVVSMSLGSNYAPTDAENPEAIAIKKMVDAGIIPVIAAGNAGPGAETIGSPGCVHEALTVGAADTLKGEIAAFSSRGPTAGDGFTKPDVLAPGVKIDSAIVGFLDAMVDPTAPKYGAISGTSMATPHVAGLLACARQLYRERYDTLLTADMVKAAMARAGQTKDNESGWGFITWDILVNYAEEASPQPADILEQELTRMKET